FFEGFWYKIFDWWDVAWKQVNDFEEFFEFCNKVKLVDIWMLYLVDLNIGSSLIGLH
ncbi:hypothetical protein J1N35_028518, partial [Gossypium stocksii]